MTKITKIKTRGGVLGMPVTTELDAIVTRMRSDDSKEVANRIHAVALHSRLMEAEGMPRYYIKDCDNLPYLVFSATFGKRGLEHPLSFSQLLLLDIPCPEGLRQVTELKNRVAQLPYTPLAFAGVSGVTLKVVVRCQYSNDEKPWVLTDKTLDADKYLAFLKTAHECAARIYTSLTMCDLIVDEQSLAHGCRMSHDPQLYYNPEAIALPVVRTGDSVLQAYEGTKADDDGQVVWYPDYDERERIQMEYYTCLSKALDEQPTCDEQEIQRHNRPYQQASSIEEVLTNLFAPTNKHKRENFWQVQDIQKELSKHLKASDVPNIIKLGKILKALRWPRGGNTGSRGYYLQLKES